MSKHEIEVKTLMNRDEAIEHLEKLAQCLKAGKVVIERGKRFVSISPEEKISFELECSQKKDKEKISFELSWNPTPPDPDPEDQLTISFNEPDVEGPKEAKNGQKTDDTLKIR